MRRLGPLALGVARGGAELFDLVRMELLLVIRIYIYITEEER